MIYLLNMFFNILKCIGHSKKTQNFIGINQKNDCLAETFLQISVGFGSQLLNKNIFKLLRVFLK